MHAVSQVPTRTRRTRLELHLGLAQRLDLTAFEHEAAFEDLENFVVAARHAIGGDGFGPSLVDTLRGHREARVAGANVTPCSRSHATAISRSSRTLSTACPTRPAA